MGPMLHAAVIAAHAGHEHLAKLIGQAGEAGGDLVLGKLQRLEDRALICLAKLLMDVARDHVATERHDDAGVDDLVAHVVLRQG